MVLSNTRLAIKPSKFDHDVTNIHSTTTQHYGRHIALRGRLAALGFTPLFTRVERLSAGLTLTGGASAAGIGAAGTGAAGIGPTGMGAAGMGAGGGMGERQKAGQQSQADPARTHPDQGTVGWPEQVLSLIHI